MNRIFSVVTLCFAISGCSFFSTPMSTSETVKASIGKHINTVKGSSTAKVTSLDNGGKKYVITQRFEPMAPMPCYQSSFDDSPSFCGTEFGMPGSSDTSTYLVNSKGVVYDVSYESELIPVPAGGGINYIR